MALIVESVVRKGILLLPKLDVSSAYLEVDSKYLSKQYDVPLAGESWAEGVVLGGF